MLNSYLTARNYIRNINLSVSVRLNVMNVCYYSVRKFFPSPTRKDENYVCLCVKGL